MAANTGKVVPLRQDEAEQKAASKPESLAMLSTCRDLAADLLSKSLIAMLDKIEESLYDLAEGATDREAQNMYMQARGEAQNKRSAIEVEFRRKFVDGFNRMLGGKRAPKAGFDSLDLENMELSLVAQDDYEENMTASNIAAKLKNACGDELQALNQRIGSLMSMPEPDSPDNPMSPQAIVEAFRAACKQIESDLNVRLLVLKQFEQVAGDNVSNVYQDVNKFLIQRNILPILPKAAVRRRKPGQERITRGASFGAAEQAGGGSIGDLAAAMQGAAAMGAGDMPSYAVGNEQELIATLQHLMSLNQMMQQTQAGMMAPPMSGAAGAGIATAAPMGSEAAAPSLASLSGNLGQSFLDALNQLQQGNAIGAMSDVGELDFNDLINGSGNVLHQIKTTSLASSLGHLDAMTIDIVAMLFDYIFDDRNLPSAMKAQIGRLQIPVLKVAMLDSKFFARKNHPTRKLLDTLSVAALGWNESDGLDDRLYRKIAELVNQIVVGFDENIGIFESTLVDLQTFLVEEERRAAEATEDSAQNLADEERRELVAAMADQAIGERLTQPELPELIRNFIAQQWRVVLIHVALKTEHADEAWRSSVQAMDDLVWSVRPKVGVEERLRLVNLLPRLLKQLEQSTQDAGVERQQREAFFAELVQAHASAIRSGLKQNQPAAPAVAPVVPPAASGAKPPLPSAAAAEPASVRDPIPEVVPSVVLAAPAEALPGLLGDLPSMTMEPALASFEVNNLAWDAGLDKYGDYDDVVANQLKRGSWVEFRSRKGETTRAKLAWVSPRKSRFLFTNRKGENGAEYTLAELVAMFKAGTASLIEGGPLVERAVSDMMDLLQPASA